jgi:formylglycine-generating enzyme required for sulfatase activity
MVSIAAGTFMRGCNTAVDSHCDADESPYASVTMSAFTIDKHEVTEAAYQNCVTAGICTSPSANFDPTNNGCLPVRNVTWTQASAYCTYLGKSLPTEAQWEMAARGNTGSLYPWGNTVYSCTLSQYNSCGLFPIAVGSKPAGASAASGALDMAGNVAEWVRDYYSGNYYSTGQIDPTGPPATGSRVFRGGGYQAPAVGSLRVSDRNAESPTASYPDLGFRCGK